MSLITLIDNLPLYSKIEDAIAWGESLGINGTHTHSFQGQTGYMAGSNHDDIQLVIQELGINLSGESETVRVVSTPVETLVVTVEPPLTTNPDTPIVYFAGGGSSGGGGY